jgi:beta-1,4-mannosyltransferase
MKKNKIVFYPKDSNPYQGLLIKSLLKEKNVDIIYGESFIPFRIFEYRLKGYNIFHLHWLFPFQFYFLKKYGYIYKVISTLYLIIFIILLKLLRYKIVYTMHDLVSHDEQFMNEQWATRLVIKVSNATIVHSTIIKEEMDKIGFNIINTWVIPIGTYLNIYKDTVSKLDARRLLNISKDKFVFLFFGLVKEYKGIDVLLENFINLSKSEKNIKLLIVGKCLEKELQTEIEKKASKYKELISLVIEFIPEDKVQHYFNSADICVLPFKKVTTSSTAILSLSFSKPIITPRLGALKDLPEDVGYFYSPSDSKGLINSMKRAIKEKSKLEKLGNNGLIYAKSLSWENTAKKTLELYRSLN